MSRSGSTHIRIPNHRSSHTTALWSTCFCHELYVVWTSTNSDEREFVIPALEQGVYKSHMTVIGYSSLGLGNQSALSCFQGPKPCLGLAAATFWASAHIFFATATDSAGSWEEPCLLKQALTENPEPKPKAPNSQSNPQPKSKCLSTSSKAINLPYTPPS